MVECLPSKEKVEGSNPFRRSVYYVYILHSLKDQKFYIGFTSYLKRRIEEHNLGKNISTKYRLPLKLIYYERFFNKTEATKREKLIKSYKGGNAFKKLIKFCRGSSTG